MIFLMAVLNCPSMNNFPPLEFDPQFLPNDVAWTVLPEGIPLPLIHFGSVEKSVMHEAPKVEG